MGKVRQISAAGPYQYEIALSQELCRRLLPHYRLPKGFRDRSPSPREIVKSFFDRKLILS
jgi:hypothetical protein